MHYLIVWSFPSNNPDTKATISLSMLEVLLGSNDKVIANAGIRHSSTHLLLIDNA